MKRLLCALGVAVLVVGGCQYGPKHPTDNRPPEWAVEKLPLPTGSGKLWINVIRGTGADDVWLLTNADRDGHMDRLVFHFDGSKWVDVTEQVPARARNSVFPIAKGDVWTVGVQGTAAHFDGKSWTVHRLPNYYYDFIDVFARPNDVWICDAGHDVIHYDGRAWNMVSPTDIAKSKAYIVWGTHDQVLVPVNPPEPPELMARFDGTRWTSEAVGPGGLTLIDGTSDTDIWALSRQNQGYHYDGTRWTRFPTLAGVPMWSLSVAGPGRAYAAGDNGVILRWDGQSWNTSPTGTRERLVSVYAPADGKALAGGDKLYRQK
jgi:hypothetical protein